MGGGVIRHDKGLLWSVKGDDGNYLPALQEQMSLNGSSR